MGARCGIGGLAYAPYRCNSEIRARCKYPFSLLSGDGQKPSISLLKPDMKLVSPRYSSFLVMDTSRRATRVNPKKTSGIPSRLPFSVDLEEPTVMVASMPFTSRAQ